MKDKKLMRDIASGIIAEPRLTLTVDGEEMVITGKSCKYFALGYLTGLKAVYGNVSVDDNTTEEGGNNG